MLEREIKTGWIHWHLSHQNVCQSRLECLDRSGHKDISQQLVPNQNSCREETIVEGIDTPSWNTEFRSMSSRILSVWSQIQWCRYCDQSVDYSVHHHSSGLIPKYFQCGLSLRGCFVQTCPFVILILIRTSNVFQPSCHILRVGLPLLLEERPEWLCGLLQSFMTDRAARLLAVSIW